MNCQSLTVINLKLHTQSDKKNLAEYILLALLGVLMYVSQVLMSQLPNIEIVSLLIILTARTFGYKSLASVFVFVGLEILTYGISLWVINYLYVWAIWCFVICIFRKIDNVWFYTVLSSFFGILFGTLCSIPYFFSGGFGFGISYIISGLRFDILHCIGNLVLTLILYKPLTQALNRALKPHN